ncbi:hypothetical protein [Lonepinella koalarum]|uniref:HTH cro/C1-type domain-containing protein n=1 Tax=Lonepinella koalarum TaxID=53417 RepID=A0A4R1KX61_9PAST|nr:hypothetical protein [Lonepinella koalarum]MDH2927750.1 hypothetical protein [Lonepinella koalarum]TCK69945.1 hypothetical protein EV692_1166 [Lonepinella koalarum]TFJ90451.1 hypothetical protein E0709_03680 [Lonepinella koalarum]
MNENEKFTQKLTALLIEKGYEPKPSVLEREFNLRYYGTPLTQQAVGKWLKGKSIPHSDKLCTLAEWLGVELTNLVSEERAYQAQKAKKKKENKANLSQAISNYYDEDYLFRLFLNLPQEQKKAVREVIMAMHKAYRAK